MFLEIQAFNALTPLLRLQSHSPSYAPNCNTL